MKEIISIHVGSSGINPGKEYWKLKSYENGIGEDGVLTNKSDNSELNSYFFETNKGEYKARALFVDLDSNTTEDLKNFEMQNIVSKEMIFNPLSIPVSCWAASYYTTGTDIIDKFVDTFISHAETCDSLEGIQLFYSLHGAYSSGFGSLVNTRLSDSFGDKFRINYNSFLGPNSNVFEYYNTLLSINSKCDVSILYDYDALYNYCKNIQKIEDVTEYDMDSIVGRIPQYDYITDKNSSSLIDQIIVPGVRKNFAFATVEYDDKSNLSKMVENSMKGNYNLLSFSPNKIIRKHFSFKGKVSQNDVTKNLDKCLSIGKFTETHENKFNSFTTSFSKKTVFVDNKAENNHINLTTLTLDNGISQLFKKFNENIDKFYRRRVFIHYYVGEGIDGMEFTENTESLNSIISNLEELQ